MRPEALAAAAQGAAECRCFPGDECWPSEAAWSAFNSTVGGKLIRTVPLASVCHDPDYDEEACSALRAVWNDVGPHIESTHSIMAPLYANASCDPFAPRDVPCVVGTYVQYTVNASSVEDISETIRFANEQNIRLVIRNTGHDYLGKSTGAGALAIWTKHLKHLSYIPDFSSSSSSSSSSTAYAGPALRLGAGVTGAEAAAFAQRHGLVTPTGNCPSVGVAGGYVQAGGHGPLTSRYGLAADQVLAWEVVDGTGRLRTVSITDDADKDQDQDLFWALAGGGPGTYGVVVSVTVRAYPDEGVAFATLGFAITGATETEEEGGLSESEYDGVVEAFEDLLPSLVDRGCTVYWLYTPTFFQMQELVCPGHHPHPHHSAELFLRAVLAPFRDRLAALEDRGAIAVTSDRAVRYDTYREFQERELGIWDRGHANNAHFGNWLLPRGALATTTSGGGGRRKRYAETVREVSRLGAFTQHIAFRAERPEGALDNAVLPAWRDAFVMVVVGTLWNPEFTISEASAARSFIHETLVPKYASLAPESGSYMVEATPSDKSWKSDLYGANYDRLLEIKDRYDPHHLFYAYSAVGSDYWVEMPDKRLCRAGTTTTAASSGAPEEGGEEEEAGKDEL
ncbi:isoamyl alcohol oxidase [Xylariomycetidae sp. FL2044]|nr:isoamyl alcohol oxidase [Xylariomycetidae sp. FL2044]